MENLNNDLFEELTIQEQMAFNGGGCTFQGFRDETIRGMIKGGLAGSVTGTFHGVFVGAMVGGLVEAADYNLDCRKP
jgi:hypothetical protein